MYDKKQEQQLAAELARVDRRRAELEIMLENFPRCHDAYYGRDELEAELRDLWAMRTQIAGRLGIAVRSLLGARSSRGPRAGASTSATSPRR